ncbi:MAG: glycerol-3-phosphate acyltransferase [Bryobacteraceae bacterium]
MELRLIVELLCCFLIGSIPFAVLAMRGTGIDILNTGSRNPGFNNVLRYSKSRAIITLIGDFGKGMLAVWMFHDLSKDISLGWMYGAATVVGHCYSPFLKFRGGKGIATSGGVMLMLYPFWAAICLAVFAIVRVTGSKRKWLEAGTIASLTTWLLFTFLMLVFAGRQDALYAALMSLFVAWRHKSNFKLMLAAAGARRQRPERQMSTTSSA